MIDSGLRKGSRGIFGYRTIERPIDMPHANICSISSSAAIEFDKLRTGKETYLENAEKLVEILKELYDKGVESLMQYNNGMYFLYSCQDTVLNRITKKYRPEDQERDLRKDLEILREALKKIDRACCLILPSEEYKECVDLCLNISREIGVFRCFTINY